jgi:trans-2,3-dihydro-3-hydroxyanthranilate isomerase
LSQPIPTWEPFESERQLLAAIAADTSSLPIELYRTGPAHVFVEFASEEAVAALRPDMGRLAELGVAVNCFAGEGSRFKTRMFCPAGGVPEDAATGSAAGPLAVHLARHGRIAFGQQITVRQGEEIGRPSLLYATARGQSPDRIESVEVGGAAVIVASGQFRIATD